MLYNESTGKPKVQADIFSLESLIAWLETMPANEEYNWASSECLLCRYLTASGRHPLREYGRFPIEARVAVLDPLHEGDWTFGAALDRARKALVA